MKRKALFLLLVFIPLAYVYAVDLGSVLDNAKLNSRVYQGYEISHENTLIGLEQKNLQGVVVSVNGGINYSEKATTVSSSSVNVTVPDLFEEWKLIFNTAISQIEINKDKPVTMTPTVSVSKDFDIKSFTDSRKAMEDLKTDLQTEINYRTNIVNFENSVINAVMNIMQAKSKLDDAEKSYSRALKTYENDKKLGSVEEGSLSDIEQKMRLETTRFSLETMKVSYEKAMKDFTQQYGISYEEITEVPEANLTFVVSEKGNSTVQIALMNLEATKQDLEEALGNTAKLSIEGSASTSLKVNGDNENSALALKASAKYSSNNWELTSTISDSFGKGQSGVPSVSLTGRWTSNTAKAKSDELSQQRLYNSILEKENSYSNAVYNYETNAQNLIRDIENHKNDVEQLKIQTDYHKSIYDYQTKLYELGLTTKQNLDDAKANYESDLRQALIQKLQAVVLENRIKIIEL